MSDNYKKPVLKITVNDPNDISEEDISINIEGVSAQVGPIDTQLIQGDLNIKGEFFKKLIGKIDLLLCSEDREKSYLMIKLYIDKNKEDPEYFTTFFINDRESAKGNRFTTIGGTLNILFTNANNTTNKNIAVNVSGFLNQVGPAKLLKSTLKPYIRK